MNPTKDTSGAGYKAWHAIDQGSITPMRVRTLCGREVDNPRREDRRPATREALHHQHVDCGACIAANDRAVKRAVRAANDARRGGASRVIGARGVVVALAKAGDVVRPAPLDMACITGAEEDGAT